LTIFQKKDYKKVIDYLERLSIDELEGGEIAQSYEDRTEKDSYIYLMKNTRNGYTKIGISKNPKHREKTLQSEEPEIDLIWKKEIPNAIGREIELHKKYSDKRIRGEWFDLTEQDIQNITLNI
jgi:hypothetical protein